MSTSPPDPIFAAEPTGPREGKALPALICGIASFLVCPLVLSVAAIVLGVQSRKAIDASPNLQGRGMATAGMVLGIVTLALSALALVVIVASSGGS